MESSYDKSLRELLYLREPVTLKFKGYSPAFISFAADNNLPTIMQDFSCRGSITELAERGLEKMDCIRDDSIHIEGQIPSFFVAPHDTGKGTIGVDQFRKKNRGETFLYSFEVYLKRNREQRIWQPFFEGYSFTGDIDVKDTRKINRYLHSATREEIEELGRELLTRKSRELLQVA